LYGELNRIIDVLNFSPTEQNIQKALLPERATTLASVLEQIVSYEDAVEALTLGLAEQLNLTLKQMPLSSREQALVDQLLSQQCNNESWLKRV
jgi:hypothetical protein